LQRKHIPPFERMWSFQGSLDMIIDEAEFSMT